MSDNDSEKEVPGVPPGRFWFKSRDCYCGGDCRFRSESEKCPEEPSEEGALFAKEKPVRAIELFASRPK